MARKFIDCRDFPSESACSLRISGEEGEVLRAASMHAVDVHGEKDTPELRSELRGALRDEVEPTPRTRPEAAAVPATH